MDEDFQHCDGCPCPAGCGRSIQQCCSDHLRFVSFHFDAPYTFCDSRTFAGIDATAAGRVEDASSDDADDEGCNAEAHSEVDEIEAIPMDASSDDADDEGCNAEANSEVDEIAAIDEQFRHMGIGVEAFDLDAMD